MDQVARASLRKIRVIEYMNPDAARLLRSMDEPRRFDTILVADQGLAKKVEPILCTAPARGVSVEYLPEVVERTLKKIPSVVMRSFTERYDAAFTRPRSDLIFRLLDIILAMTIFIILLPGALLATLLILLGDGRPIFYAQDRHGLHGRKFKVIKFRTLDAEPGDPSGDAPLVFTRSGRFLRKTHLNEIPQLLNVLAGHMSLVGPRPDIPSTYDACRQAIPRYTLRTEVPPGLTGIAQIYYRHIDALDLEAFSERLAFDAYYVKNRSPVLYLQVMLLTARNFVFGRGA
jgi:lipopolysaccharide/colanic/teichoic acid biosynthesis glycosyltransferase